MSAGTPDYFSITNAFRETGWGGARAQIFYYVLGAGVPIALHATQLARLMRLTRSTASAALSDLRDAEILRCREGLYEVASDRRGDWPKGRTYTGVNLPGRPGSVPTTAPEPAPTGPSGTPAHSPWRTPIGYVNGPDDVLRPLTADPRIDVPDPAEVKRVADKADRLFDPQKDFGYQVATWVGQYDLAWIERALEDAATWPHPPSTFQPILNKLRTWAENGGPPKLAELSPRRRPPARGESAGMTSEEVAAELARRRKERRRETGVNP